ncbi:hypothetical protein [Pseudomaricurvus sp. HS19]|uniref:hypothetical protein n=1 Tax=Pseudomaricurvus sp. HS19 TaxID=2692626 RepID=UPI00136BA479|nr:hypothetical protein [Pseudomaricurvus sp. HS19]MYM64127.1 hypothetical protein [Pseudomaricurvus sp. HS19]
MQLKTSPAEPFENVNVVGLALKSDPENPRQTHLAILYKFHEEPKLMHLAWNRDFRARQNPSDSYLWLDLGEYFSDYDREIICAHVQNVADANDPTDIGYGFDCSGSYFDPETGKFNSSFSAVGLTCATFVIEVFASCGYKLVDLNSWPMKNKEAIKWQRKMLDMLVTLPDVTQEFIERQTRNVGNRRYLPEQVAASSQGEIPVPRGRLLLLSKEMRDQVVRHCKSKSTSHP